MWFVTGTNNNDHYWVTNHMFQMVGLYKDPKGETISTQGTSGLRDDLASDKSSDTELKMLRHRVIQLENSLRKHVSF